MAVSSKLRNQMQFNDWHFEYLKKNFQIPIPKCTYYQISIFVVISSGTRFCPYCVVLKELRKIGVASLRCSYNFLLKLWEKSKKIPVAELKLVA